METFIKYPSLKTFVSYILVVITFLSICSLCYCYYPVRSLDFLWIWSGFIRWALSVDHLRFFCLTQHWPHGHHPHQSPNQHDGSVKGYMRTIHASNHFQNHCGAFRHFSMSGEKVKMLNNFTVLQFIWRERWYKPFKVNAIYIHLFVCRFIYCRSTEDHWQHDVFVRCTLTLSGVFCETKTSRFILSLYYQTQSLCSHRCTMSLTNHNKLSYNH